MKVLNLYCGIGGNRKLWVDIEVTAVEIVPEIASIYSHFYPSDKIVVGDAHNYLIEHFEEFDFIWSSPPCKSHSQIRQNLSVKFHNTTRIYPDMSLYQEIIFLKHNFKGLWVVENTKPYYDFLINPTFKLGRHVFWSNFYVKNPGIRGHNDNMKFMGVKDFEVYLDINLSYLNSSQSKKLELLRNCVHPMEGKIIFNVVLDYLSIKQDSSTELLF